MRWNKITSYTKTNKYPLYTETYDMPDIQKYWKWSNENNSSIDINDCVYISHLCFFIFNMNIFYAKDVFFLFFTVWLMNFSLRENLIEYRRPLLK